MRTIHRGISLIVALLLASAGTASAAQKPRDAKPGEEIIVTQSASGEELRGRLVELSPTSLGMLVNGHRVDVPVENVLRIDARTDSVKDGAIIGASIMGVLAGLGCASFAGESNAAGNCAAALVFDVGLGALAGAGIDALHKGRTPIYIKAGKSEKALGFSLRF